LLSSQDLSKRARIGALTLHALYSGEEITANWRQGSQDALNRRLLAEIDPENKLPPEERARRLEYARKAHFASLAWKSAKARRAKKAASHERK
jgi:hypothetical protein